MEGLSHYEGTQPRRGYQGGGTSEGGTSEVPVADHRTYSETEGAVTDHNGGGHVPSQRIGQYVTVEG